MCTRVWSGHPAPNYLHLLMSCWPSLNFCRSLVVTQQDLPFCVAGDHSSHLVLPLKHSFTCVCLPIIISNTLFYMEIPHRLHKILHLCFSHKHNHFSLFHEVFYFPLISFTHILLYNTYLHNSWISSYVYVLDVITSCSLLISPILYAEIGCKVLFHPFIYSNVLLGTPHYSYIYWNSKT